MGLNVDEGRALLISIIRNGLRHQDYERTVALAKLYKQFTTGEDIAGLLRQFATRESAELFAQRVSLTEVITPDIVNTLAKPMYKVGRTHANIVIAYPDNKEGGDEGKKTELMASLQRFYGNMSVSKYLEFRLVELDVTDPNSFIVVEFNERVNAEDPTSPKAQPYPFEVISEEAVMYEYVNNVLQYLCIQLGGTMKDKDGKIVPGAHYTIYLDNEAVVAKQIDESQITMELEANEQLVTIEIIIGLDQFNKPKSKNLYFVFTVNEHKVGYVPAVRVGSLRDLVTRGRTCVSIIHPAVPYLKKTVKAISEFDLTNALHTFPQKVQYTDACTGEDNVGCANGRTLIGGVCSICKGTGFKIHTSAQDSILLRMPRDPKDIIDLEKVIIYKHPPIDLIKFQEEHIFKTLKNAAQKAVYNSELFSADEVAATATEKNIDLDSVYDTLYPFALHWSEAWTTIVQTVAILRDLASGLVVSHQFPKDFKMKTLAMLVTDMKSANDSNAPSYVKKEIGKDVAQILYRDRPEELLKLDVKEKFYPFDGKTEADVQFVISNNLTTDYNKVLWAEFDLIFTELEQEAKDANEMFWLLTYAKQKERLDKKVAERIAKMAEEETNRTANTFNAAQPPADETVPPLDDEEEEDTPPIP